jgi:PAS domain S-box-containing protein
VAFPTDALEVDVLDALGLPVIVTSMDGVIRYWNRAAETTYGWRAEEALGRDIYYVIPAALPDDEIDRMMAGFAAGKAWEGELTLRVKGGEWRRTYHVDRPLLDAQGEVVGVISVSQDATAREAALEAARQQTVARPMVRAMLANLVSEGDGPRLRDMGRGFARRANCPDLAVFLRTFRDLGLGELRVVREEPSAWRFEGVDLLEARPGSRQPTCQLPLGYLEGAISALAGAEALGAEVRCQSLGHARCEFVVRARKA